MSSPVSSDCNVESSAPAAEHKPSRPVHAGAGTEAAGTATPGAADTRTGPGKGFAAEIWLLRRILQASGNPPIRLVLWNGEEISTSDEPPVARVRIHDRRTLLKLWLDANLHFGDAYSDGRLEVEGNLLEFLEAFHRVRAEAKPPGVARRTLARWRRWTRSNTLRASRANIHHHYDIGDDFYRLWLDKELVYTCAYFPTPDVTLEQAQSAKMDYVCRKLWLKPGETVVEAGCGWGALALYMARHYGVKVKAFNISHAQIAYARQRAKAEGLGSEVEFIEDDYRNISGRFDVFVSVGMLEHVGADHYRELGRVVDGCLGRRGRGLIHSIGQNQQGEISPWLRRRIFPGAYPPTLREMLDVLEPWGFSVLDVENLRLHYAETLRHWLKRFEAAADRVVEMFNERFVRAWRLYLTGSIAAFAAGSLQLFQIVMARPTVNEIPWSRARLYEDAGPRDE
jgi:cyclopropane-fatty-acyl-phospholipid synthase